MLPKHTSFFIIFFFLFYISFTYYLLRHREGADVDREVGDEKQARWAVLRVCKSSTSRAYSVYCRIKLSISNTLWPWSDSLCFLHLAAKAHNNTSIVVSQGQKACSNLAAVVCGPSSYCIVSNRTYHLYHLTVPTSERNPLSQQEQQVGGNHMNHVCWQSMEEAYRSPSVLDCSWGDSNHLGSVRHASIPKTH